MNLEQFALACQSKQPVAIVLRSDDYQQLLSALPETPGEWNREKMRYRGAPIARGEFHSYLVEDTPDGPLIHMVG